MRIMGSRMYVATPSSNAHMHKCMLIAHEQHVRDAVADLGGFCDYSLSMRMCIPALAQAMYNRYNWTGALLVVPASALVYFVAARTFHVATRRGVPLLGAQTFLAGSVYLSAMAMFRACGPHQRRYDVLASRNKITRLERNKLCLYIYIITYMDKYT